MRTLLAIALLFCALAASAAKDVVQVEVITAVVATHNDRGFGATMLKGIDPHSITGQVESYNLQTVINGERVTLACIENRCESLKPGIYQGENHGGRYVRIRFPLPLRDKMVTRSYKVIGSW